MKKTLAQIQYEMETVKLIKDAMEVDGTTAYKLLKEWTSDEPKVQSDKCSWDVTNDTINDALNNQYITGKSIAESLFEIIDSYSELNKKNK